MGNICSGCCQHVVVPTAINFNSIPKTVLTKYSLVNKSERYLENSIVIWLFDDASKNLEKEKEQVRNCVYLLKDFTDPQTCINFIKDIRDEKLFLITSMIYQSYEYFSQLSQIEKIYIFHPFQLETNEDLPKNRFTFTNINQLCEQLQFDIELCELDLFNFSTVSTSSTILTKEVASFVFIHFLNEITARIKFESSSKDVLIDLCRSHYANHPERLRVIEEFAMNYRPHDSLHWLQKRCFLSKIENRARRTHEIDILYKTGFFIKQVNIQLLRFYEENKDLLTPLSIVYQGKTVSKEELDCLLKHQSNDLISFSHMQFTTYNKDEVITFLRQRITLHPDFLGIIFEIHVDHNICNKNCPYAMVTDYRTKNEGLWIPSGATFRIESIEQLINDSLTFQVVKMKLISQDDPQLVEFLASFRANDLHENPLACLGRLLMHMEEYRRVEQFFLEMLNDASVQNQPRRLVRVENGLAANYFVQGDYATALLYYQKALKSSLTYLPPDHSDLSIVYKNIGDCYFKQNELMYALEKYEQAIRLIENNVALSSKSSFVDELEGLIDKTKQSMEIKTINH